MVSGAGEEVVVARIVVLVTEVLVANVVMVTRDVVVESAPTSAPQAASSVTPRRGPIQTGRDRT